MERSSENEIKLNTPVQRGKEKGSTCIKSKIFSIIGAGAIAAGNLVHPESSQADSWHPFNNRSREVLLVCLEESQSVSLYFDALWNMRVNRREFAYGGNFAVVIGNKETNQAYLGVVGSDLRDTYIENIRGYVNKQSTNLVESVDKLDASFTPGVYRYRHPNIPDLQRYTFDEHRENLIEGCYTETRIPQYPLPI
ncbi:hypothetical protein A3F00_02680 [Candidatus Daviesbacteria bacterium RIFCSPHIGHO2_12_FULL_37_11]|uniref:Uncharacterized protein n=1 Tax=Candidatus Daviesbacteria bacterium RIFCSPHIGHO2_12_FULL_37_11 TaxID=1797777 RepID=A0A1F5KFE7_9BACT|nr:MAG: hypothetical protein A2111_01015 [Candidatus Daviesbacteria bacterium GWA1_38_6]OGE16246.1 MAG: hypothetical protein A2769_02505 [Candidatus Daviesbacteria bacterium RIFCSPHIGHO2_01_FULL_37_27]OGE39341.1 MAG: hypothetical protein A3F00_02680 [Candidatus Daviesbacteria bacterium RIFCSPHIGHO2_12_FULL_37_11]OGE45137.1 MAG: hypothetical protein A3B39_01850 [Candidatus Daviesbacteria bacterium RIFCSPLOWO2_01_FULL_37_10]